MLVVFILTDQKDTSEDGRISRSCASVSKKNVANEISIFDQFVSFCRISFKFNLSSGCCQFKSNLNSYIFLGNSIQLNQLIHTVAIIGVYPLYKHKPVRLRDYSRLMHTPTVDDLEPTSNTTGTYAQSAIPSRSRTLTMNSTRHNTWNTKSKRHNCHDCDSQMEYSIA